MDNYRRGWALRYLREARAEFTAAQKTPHLAPSLILEAMRKAQTAIYYSLGEPAFIETIIRQAAERRVIDDPILRCLVEIKRTIHQIAQASDSELDRAIRQVNGLIQITSDIVELLTGEKA